MSEPQNLPEVEQGSVLLGQITVKLLIDSDDDQAITVAVTSGLGQSQALGMLEHAKLSLWDAWKGR